MGISTSTGTLTAGQSRTFNLSPASAVTLTLLPNARVTITESPAAVTATGLGGNATRVHEPRLPGTFTYGPYPMGGSVVVENESNSGSSVGWVRSDSIVAESADGAQSLVDGAGNVTEIIGGVLSLTSDASISTVLRGATIQFWPGRTLTLTTGSRLIDCKFDFSHITSPSHYPNQFISIVGDDIEIRGCKSADGAGLPYPYEFDSSTVGRFISFGGDCDNVRILNNEILHGFYCIYAKSRTLSNIRIQNNLISGARNGVFFDNVLGDQIRVNGNTFLPTPHTSPVTSLGEIHLVFGYQHMTVGGLTNAAYLTRYGKGIDVSGNMIPATSHRAIWVINAVGVNVTGNHVNFEAVPGDDTGASTSDDCIILDMCRNFALANNHVYASGENGFDISGCKHGTITGNTADNCDIIACAYDWCDAVKAGFSTGFDHWNHFNEDIVSSGNSWTAGEIAISIKGGARMKFADKIGKFYGKRPGLGGYDVAVVCYSDYTTKAAGTWPADLDFSGTTKVRSESVLVNAWSSGNVLTTSAEHGFNSGNRVTVWLESPTGGTMITGLDDITDYYVIRLSATSFSLATSHANATAATPTAIALSGSLVGNLYVGEVQAGRVSLGATPGNDIRGLKMSRDLAEVSAPTSVAATTNYIYTLSGLKGSRDAADVRFGYMVRDASATFGAGSNSSVARMFEFPSGYCTDTAVRGIAVQWIDRTQVKYRTGANLLPVPATAVAGAPGTGVAGITSGYVRVIVL